MVVSVVDADPVARLEALLDGYLVPDREEALRDADVIVTMSVGAESCVVPVPRSIDESVAAAFVASA